MRLIEKIGVGLWFLGTAIGCGEDDRASVCRQAADKMMACIGTEAPFDVNSCLSNGDSFEMARQVGSMSCEDLQKLEVVRGEGGTACIALAGLFGFCKPAFPTFPCASDLGQAVADAVCKSNYFWGMVPAEWLYTSQNAWADPWVDAPAIFTGMADLIAGARFEADSEFYDWDPKVLDKNEPSWEIDPTMVLVDGVRRLQDRLKDEEALMGAPVVPVVVRFIVNGRHPRGYFGGELAVNKARLLAIQIKNANIDPRYVEMHLAVHENLVWGGVHSKMVVVDGYKSVVSGSNPQRFSVFGSHWHDTGYLTIGEIGIAMQRDFDDTWLRSREVESCDFDNFDGVADCKLLSKSAIVHSPRVAYPSLDDEPTLANACLPMIAASRRPYNPWTGDPFVYNCPQNAAYLALMQNASQVIKIETVNLNDAVAKEAIVAAVKRGIEVRLILSQGFNSVSERSSWGPFSLGGANEDTVPELYAALADPTACSRLQIRWYTPEKGEPPIYDNIPRNSHTKYMTADGKVALVGSANLDLLSWALIQESNVLVDDPAATAAYDRIIFDLDWDKAEDNEVFAWSRRVLDGTVEIPQGLSDLLNGDVKGYATKLLAICGQ